MALAVFVRLPLKSWLQAFTGYHHPNNCKHLLKSDQDAAVWILGTHLPLALFLGTASLILLQNLPFQISQAPVQRQPSGSSPPLLTFPVSYVPRRSDYRTQHKKNNLTFVLQHLGHGKVDVIASCRSIQLHVCHFCPHFHIFAKRPCSSRNF